MNSNICELHWKVTKSHTDFRRIEPRPPPSYADIKLPELQHSLKLLFMQTTGNMAWHNTLQALNHDSFSLNPSGSTDVLTISLQEQVCRLLLFVYFCFLKTTHS